MRALRFLLRKEFLQIFRDRTILAMLIGMPIVQLIVLSNAATFEVRDARLAVVDLDRSTASRGVVSHLVASGRFVPAATPPSVARATKAILDREADLILVIPADFGRDLVRARRATVQLILNAENGAAAGVSQGYAVQILQRYAAELGADVQPSLATIGVRDAPPRRGTPTIEVRERGWYNPSLEYREYMVPAILVVLVTMVGTLLTAMNIVREREAGTLDQLNVTPISRGTFIAAKLLPLWTLALVDLALGLLVAHFLLDVPVRGSVLVVFLGGAIYLVGALGLGLWISTVAETQQQAMFISFGVLMLYMLMSGIFTPVTSMPPWAQWVAQASPVLHFARIMRAVLLKGAGLADVAPQLAALVAIGGTVLVLAVRQYRKRAA